MTRILIADDHEVVRSGLRKILEAHPEWEVVAEVADGRDAVRKVAETKPDVAVLDYSLPLLNGHDFIAFVAFIGGLSAATAMVIVETVALSIMISNDLIIPLFMRRLLSDGRGGDKDWSNLILNIRRGAIFLILFAAFLYYRESTNNARLASIGLMSFAAIAQLGPAFLGGLFWRGANAKGAANCMSVEAPRANPMIAAEDAVMSAAPKCAPGRKRRMWK